MTKKSTSKHKRVSSRNDVERLLAAKAAKDQRFRDELVRDPKKVVSREFNLVNLPDDLEINVLEETPRRVYLVLPPSPESLKEMARRPMTNTKWIWIP
jgi:nitrile hydratase alpha subunit